MRDRLLYWWSWLRASFWFLPSLLAVAAVALSAVILWLDGRFGRTLALPWLETGSIEGARTVLATIAASTITLTGVIFSITIVSLTLASSQFGHRLLRNFMRDAGNQVVLGLLIGTFLYCLLVLRVTGSGQGGDFLPSLSVTMALGLALVSVGAIIYFLHHTATAIQASSVILRVSRDLEVAIDTLFPDEAGVEPDEDSEHEPAKPGDFEERAAVVASPHSGFVQIVDVERLMAAASEEELLVEVVRRPGQFALAGAPLLRAYPGERVDDRLAERLAETIFLGAERSHQQDVEHSIEQLVEVAVRALSPGINDPFTAISCLEYLGAALLTIGRRRIPSAYRYDEDGRLRIIARLVSYDGMLDAAFHQIRQYGARNEAVLMRMLEILAELAQHTRRSSVLEALRRHARLVYRAGRAEIDEAEDRLDLWERYAAVCEHLDLDPGPPPSGGRTA